MTWKDTLYLFSGSPQILDIDFDYTKYEIHHEETFTYKKFIYQSVYKRLNFFEAKIFFMDRSNENVCEGFWLKNKIASLMKFLKKFVKE